MARQRIVDDLEELEELRQEEGDDVSVAELRKILAARRKASKERARALARARRRGAPRVKLPGGTHDVLTSRPWWRRDGARWLRTDGRTWPDRPLDVLEGELALMDQTIALRAGSPERWPSTGRPVPERAWRRVPRERAAGPLFAVVKLAQLQRRLATAERDARVRSSAVAAADFARRLVAAQRQRVIELRVGVPWGGVIVGRGVAP